MNPRGYAILHRMHHAYSDTEKDPHSPLFASDALSMMLKTKHEYDDFAYRRRRSEPRFEGDYPEWDFIDKLGQSWAARLGWVGIYAVVYFQFATSPWLFLLLPVQAVVGPVHGAIVNWCGHKYGYQNFDNGDASRNTLFVDFLTAGELFQNNHHKFAMSPNFAARAWEVDPTYIGIRDLPVRSRSSHLKGTQRMRFPRPPPRVEPSSAGRLPRRPRRSWMERRAQPLKAFRQRCEDDPNTRHGTGVAVNPHPQRASRLRRTDGCSRRRPGARSPRNLGKHASPIPDGRQGDHGLAPVGARPPRARGSRTRAATAGRAPCPARRSSQISRWPMALLGKVRATRVQPEPAVGGVEPERESAPISRCITSGLLERDDGRIAMSVSRLERLRWRVFATSSSSRRPG